MDVRILFYGLTENQTLIANVRSEAKKAGVVLTTSYIKSESEKVRVEFSNGAVSRLRPVFDLLTAEFGTQGTPSTAGPINVREYSVRSSRP
jgi:hypothetical protein